MDIAKRCEQNPHWLQKRFKSGNQRNGNYMFVKSRVFKYQGKFGYFCVAERLIQKEGIISFPIYNEKGKIEVVSVF